MNESQKEQSKIGEVVEQTNQESTNIATQTQLNQVIPGTRKKKLRPLILAQQDLIMEIESYLDEGWNNIMNQPDTKNAPILEIKDAKEMNTVEKSPTQPSKLASRY